MQKLKLKPVQGDAYIDEKLRLREKLYAISYPVTTVSMITWSRDYHRSGTPSKPV